MDYNRYMSKAVPVEQVVLVTVFLDFLLGGLELLESSLLSLVLVFALFLGLEFLAAPVERQLPVKECLVLAGRDESVGTVLELETGDS